MKELHYLVTFNNHLMQYQERIVQVICRLNVVCQGDYEYSAIDISGHGGQFPTQNLAYVSCSSISELDAIKKLIAHASCHLISAEKATQEDIDRLMNTRNVEVGELRGAELHSTAMRVLWRWATRWKKRDKIREQELDTIESVAKFIVKNKVLDHETVLQTLVRLHLGDIVQVPKD